MEALPPQALMNRMLTGYWISQALYVSAKLGIADLLVNGPRSSDDLAAATNMHAPSLYRLLRATASVGVFAEDDQRRFSSRRWPNVSAATCLGPSDLSRS